MLNLSSLIVVALSVSEKKTAGTFWHRPPPPPPPPHSDTNGIERLRKENLVSQWAGVEAVYLGVPFFSEFKRRDEIALSKGGN